MALARLDRLLVDRGLARSREAAREMIEAGRVRVRGVVRGKAASQADAADPIDVEPAADGCRWVSRGAHKLIRALGSFRVDPSGLDCIDIGASTGGFTQVLLSRGAARVAAVDVGFGQLAWELRNDPRVSVFERANARYITADEIGFEAALLTVDASFISLRLLLPNLERLVSDGGSIIALVKPQFEAGRGGAPKGVVRSASVRAEALGAVVAFARERTSLALTAADWSPIKGPKGNVEFLFHLVKGEGPSADMDFAELASRASDELEGDGAG